MLKYASLVALSLAACAPATPPEPPPSAPPQGNAQTGAYHAQGNEPGWSLTMYQGEMRYSGDYGETNITVPEPEGRPSFNGWRYVTDRLTVDITYSPCEDSMNDVRYSDSVMVTADGKTVKGCGGSILPPEWIADTRWRIVAIDGEAPVAPERAEIAFDGRGRISGSAGCNRFGGTFSAAENVMTVSPLVMTRMACIGPVGDQEAAVVALLEAGSAIGSDGDDRMTLTGAKHRLVLERVK